MHTRNDFDNSLKQLKNAALDSVASVVLVHTFRNALTFHQPEHEVEQESERAKVRKSQFPLLGAIATHEQKREIARSFPQTSSMCASAPFRLGRKNIKTKTKKRDIRGESCERQRTTPPISPVATFVYLCSAVTFIPNA